MVGENFDKDIVQESTQQLTNTLVNNRRMTENSLRMRAMAYLAQVKANLLTETIFEVEHSRKSVKEELLKKEEMLFIQSKNAAMGEMISMIAHQWRQPISAIAMDANNILVDIELEALDATTLKETSLNIIDKTKELSKTIDDFRDFIKPDKRKEKLLASSIIQNALGIIGSSLTNNTIALKVDIVDDKIIQIYARELMQALINIISNAKDTLVQNGVKNRSITITQEIKNEQIIITICDNGGGIEDSIKDKIFKPYFSTKKELNGTGLGLYMSQLIVEKHLGGSLTFSNKNGGTCFEIRLPQTLQKEEAL